MKKLIAKIREILRNRRVRKIWTRTVSSIACLVVFVTTYALVLPAITMESQASCGIEAHQHDDSCYEERLTCTIPESEGHTHTEDCYSTKQKLICDRSEHEHNSDCYDENGNLTCSLEEHQHGRECFEETRELVCGLEEAEGHHHDSSCYEKVLTCGKEAHTHSQACYREDAASAMATEGAAVASTTAASEGGNTAAADTAASEGGKTATADTAASEEKNISADAATASADGNAAAATASTTRDTAAGADGAGESSGASGTFDPAQTASEGYVPALEELDFQQLLNSGTAIYYHRPADDTEADSSEQITDWQKADKDTVLGENDLLRVYLAYTIPAGSLNETNAVARYRLPANLHLTDDQIQAISQTENGLSGLYVDSDTLQITDAEKHAFYLGYEAIDGTRTPDQKIDDYFSDNNSAANGDQAAREIISAAVRAENVYDHDGIYGEKNAYLGTDLVFTFSPYTILKNRNEYDSEGTPVKAGESVSGWFALDINMDQVDWDHNTAEIIFVSVNKELNTGLVSATLQKAEPVSEETHPAVSFEDSLTVHTGSLGSDIMGNPGSDGTGNSKTDKDAGTLPASSNLTVSVSAESGTFPAGTTMVLSAVTDMDTVAEAVEGTVDSKTRGFQAVDISFRDKDGNEIEPLKPISVTMRSDSIKAATEDSSMAPVVVHVEDRKKETAKAGDSPAATVIETLPDTAENKEKSETPDATNSPDAISFEADAFSVYAIVYTVDFKYEVNGKVYDFSIPGGGFVSLEHLVEVLGITSSETDSKTENENVAESAESDDGEATVDAGAAQDTASSYDEAIKLNEVEVSEATKQFVENVESAEFSNPELVWVKKASEVTTVGGLKKANGLKAEYSGDLTKEQIAEIDAQTVEAGDWALISARPFTSEETLTVTMKNGEQFVVKVTDAQIVERYISDKGEMYEVTVTYGPDAQIPEGSRLKVTEFEEGSPEYLNVKKAVIADKQARRESLDFTDLAALDISIVDPSGKEIEPAAPVTVQMSILKLPGVEDLGKIAGTLKVKHHVETESGVVVETVYSGSTEAEFVMETDEAVEAAGTAVDPDTADPAALEFSSTDLYPDGSAVPNTSERQDQLNVTFETPVFSSFTVQWNTGGGSINTMASINWSNGLAYMAYVPYAQVNIHYVNQNGLPIARPSSVGDIDRRDLLNMEFSYNIGDTFGKPIDGFTYQGAHFGTYSGETVTDVTLRGYPGFLPVVWYGDVTFYNGSAQVGRLEANGMGFATVVPTADIYLVYSGESNTPHATVHYVDEEGNELTVVNGTPVSDTATRTIYPNYPYTYGAYIDNYNYLIYDVEGYEYDYTYRNINDQSHRITPVLNYDQNRWKYTKGTNQNGKNSWSNLDDGDEIYVVYKKRKTPPSGGTPIPENTDSGKLDPATITKSSKVNGDGTNTLALSVTGHAKELETQKMADVIVIYDVSGSMNYRMASEDNPGYGEKTRMAEAEAATKALAHKLLGERNTKEHPDLIRMALVSFSNTAQIVQGFTNNESTFSKAVDNLPNPDGGTNWEYALQLANEMSVASDRATFVIFVTDGNPTFRLARQVLNNGGTNGLGANDVTEYFFKYLVYGHGDSDDWVRNYAGALAQVKAIAGSNKHFYTIGIGPNVQNLTNLLTDSGVSTSHGHTATDSQQLSDAFADIGARILGTLGHSSISISDGITDLTQIVKKTNLVSNESFKEDDFTYWKGKVDHLATKAEVDSGKAAKVGDPVVLDSAWTEWDPASEKCEKAKYENDAVVWNMGNLFMPEEGYTYQVRFNVWPSQRAYDLLAELNNAADPAAAYAALPEDVRSQIREPKEAGQPYTLKTNDETSYSYKEATKVEGIVTPLPDTGANGSFDEVDPLHLTTSPLKLQKKFDYNYVDTRKPEESITLELYSKTEEGQWAKTFKTMTLGAVYQKDKDGNYIDADGRVLHEEGGTYYDADNIERERVLVEDESWYSDDNFVSYGLLTYDENDPSGTKKVYETGHDFTLRETGINAHYYELQAGTYRPMYINGTPTVLEQVVKPANMGTDAFYYTEGGKDYYKLDGKYYKDTGSDVIMSALNKHRSYMDLTKIVEGDAVANDEFEYRITFTVPENIENYDKVEQFIWFSVYNPSDRRTLAPSEYTYSGAMTADALDVLLESTEYSGQEYANYLVATSGQPFTLKIKEGWNVRFLNLPIGTTYAFEEVNIPEGYSFVSAEVSGTVWPNASTTGPASDIDSAKLPTNDGTSIGGTIELANARYKTTYTNKTLTQKINIRKTRQDGTTPLAGAEFILYTKDGYEADPKISSRSGLVSDEEGIIPLGQLAAGEYRLVETKAPQGFILLKEPIVITVNTDQTVTYTQPGMNIGVSGNGISGNVTSGYQLTVINDEGAALPHTGGPGTRLFTILGSILILGAGALLWRERRFI